MSRTCQIKKKKTARKNWIAGYVLVATAGAALGLGAADGLPGATPDKNPGSVPSLPPPKELKKETAADKLKPLKRLVEKALETDTEQPPSDSSPDTEPDVDTDKQATVPLKPSPEPKGIADGKLPDYRILPQRDPKGGAGKRVVVVEVHDVIDMGLSAHIERSIKDNPDAAALILDINTPGGRVDAATLIRDAIIGAPKTMRTVAFIHPRAISAGAFISFACDLIFIADGGSMGAATPIAIGEGGGAEPVEEKMVSYFRTEMATTARAKGRRGDIAEAMVDKDVEIKGIVQAGKLLTLDTEGALRLKIADAKANSLEEACALLALGGAAIEHTQMNWAEKLARIFTDPMLSSILMSLGVLGILIELYHPGMIFPGVVGVICLLIFFAGHLVVNLAGMEEALLFFLGLVLLGVEIFVTPGFGVLGIAGILSIVISLVLAMTSLPLDVSFSTGNLTSNLLRVSVSMIVSLIIFLVVLSILPKTVMKSPLILNAAITATAEGGREGEAIKDAIQSGMTGIAESFLRPAGIARFGDKRIDVASEGDFIEKGSSVEIVRVHGNRVTVRKKG